MPEIPEPTEPPVQENKFFMYWLVSWVREKRKDPAFMAEFEEWQRERANTPT